MDIEQVFAAEIFGAESTAALIRKHGWPQTTADMILGALVDFRECGRALGYPASWLAEIEAGLIEWDGDIPRARPMAGNVVALRQA
jgi:hypothetical protein